MLFQNIFIRKDDVDIPSSQFHTFQCHSTLQTLLKTLNTQVGHVLIVIASEKDLFSLLFLILVVNLYDTNNKEYKYYNGRP